MNKANKKSENHAKTTIFNPHRDWKVFSLDHPALRIYNQIRTIYYGRTLKKLPIGVLFAFTKDKGVSEQIKTSIWKNWAASIQRLGLQNLAVTMLEAAGPVNVVGAQLVYLSQPVLDSIVSKDQLSALAEMLEEPKQTQAFINYLQEQDLQE